MNKYTKITTLYTRDPTTHYRTLLHNVYSLPEFSYLEDCYWTWTEKLDGTNLRVIVDEGAIEYRGKSDKAQMFPGMVERLDELFLPKADLVHALFSEGQTCLYGEGVGAGINKGSGYCSGKEFVLFDIKCGHWWLKREDVEDIARKLDIQVVPIVGTGTLPAMKRKVRDGFLSKWGNFRAEGIVARPEIELKNRSGGRIITKLKYRDYFPDKEE